MVEQRFDKAQVGGSNPSSTTIRFMFERHLNGSVVHNGDCKLLVPAGDPVTAILVITLARRWVSLKYKFYKIYVDLSLGSYLIRKNRES